VLLIAGAAATQKIVLLVFFFPNKRVFLRVVQIAFYDIHFQLFTSLSLYFLHTEKPTTEKPTKHAIPVLFFFIFSRPPASLERAVSNTGPPAKKPHDQMSRAPDDAPHHRTPLSASPFSFCFFCFKAVAVVRGKKCRKIKGP
jgi:hypothetical protein